MPFIRRVRKVRSYRHVQPSAFFPKSNPTYEKKVEYKETPKYSVSDIKSIVSSNPENYFFSRDTMKFFGRQKFSTIYDKKNKRTILVVDFPARHEDGFNMSARRSRYEFRPDKKDLIILPENEVIE